MTSSFINADQRELSCCRMMADAVAIIANAGSIFREIDR
jgi:hypothetical protein